MQRHAPYLLIFAVVSLLHAFGMLWPIDRLFIDAGYSLNKRPATERLALVQIDPVSIDRVGVWPWPRSLHAQLLNRLTDAGVVEIGYDVDFSSRSTPDQDKALKEALMRARSQVILAAFRQRMTAHGGGLSLHDTLPLPEFRAAVQLGNVIFAPSRDGLIRTMRTTATWHGGDLPAMSALLAGPASFAVHTFDLDFGIDIETIPRFSFIDILDGVVPAEKLRGKKVIVGAAATELGDQHAVPVYGRLHGIELQALAFESLVQGRALHTAKPEAVIVGLLVLTLLLGARMEVFSWRAGSVIGATIGVGFTAAALLIQMYLAFIIPVTAVLVLVAGLVIFSVYRDLWANAVVIFRQRMNLIHQRAFIHEVLENSFDGVVVTNAGGRIVAHNDAAISLLRADTESLEEADLNSFLPADKEFLFPGDDEAAAKRAESSPRSPAVVRFNPTDAKPYYLEFMPGRFRRQSSRLNPSERRTEDRLFFTYTFRDVTERVTHELIQKQEKERAVEQSRAKSEVLASMSHELRTPLNAILGFSEIMKNEVLGPLTGNYRSYAEGVYESGRHLLNLIDEMLDVASIEGGKFTLKESYFNLGQTVDRCVQIIDGWQETHERFFKLDRPAVLPMMLGSDRLITQCIINLVSNAIKYSAPGDSITLRVRMEKHTGDFVIEVNDTGIGIAEEQLELITKPFYRVAGSATRDHAGGVGLGLALVQSYVDAHNGRLEIFSKLGAGTTVRITLPAERLSPSRGDDADETDPTSGKRSNIVDLRKNR